MVIDDIKQALLVGSSHELFQFDVIVVLLLFQEGLLSILLNKGSYQSIFL